MELKYVTRSIGMNKLKSTILRPGTYTVPSIALPSLKIVTNSTFIPIDLPLLESVQSALWIEGAITLLSLPSLAKLPPFFYFKSTYNIDVNLSYVASAVNITIQGNILNVNLDNITEVGYLRIESITRYVNCTSATLAWARIYGNNGNKDNFFCGFVQAVQEPHPSAVPTATGPTSTNTPVAGAGITKEKRPNIGAIVGGIFGGIIGISLVLIGIWRINKRNPRVEKQGEIGSEEPAVVNEVIRGTDDKDQKKDGHLIAAGAEESPPAYHEIVEK
jgi:hypothetical protein